MRALPICLCTSVAHVRMQGDALYVHSVCCVTIMLNTLLYSSFFPDKSSLTLLASVRRHTGVNDHSASWQKGWNSPIFNRTALMTSRRQRAGVIGMTAVLPSEKNLIDIQRSPALETPRGAPLINSPPVLNGGNVWEDVTPSQICWKWIRAGCWEGWWKGQQLWNEKQGGGKHETSGRANSLAWNWLLRFVFYVERIFIIFYVMTNTLVLSPPWMINAGHSVTGFYLLPTWA